jgi:hypothetical protein
MNRATYEGMVREHVLPTYPADDAERLAGEMLGAWDEGYLSGMQHLADLIVVTLVNCHGKADPRLTEPLKKIATAFHREMIGRGDIIPDEFEGCWLDALRSVGVEVERGERETS